MKLLRVGLDSYSLEPLGLDPFGFLDWAAAHGAEGVQFSGVSPETAAKIDAPYLEDLRKRAAELGLYIEWGGGRHIPVDMTTWRPEDIARRNRTAAEQAALLGTRVIRSCSGGLMRWRDDAPSTEDFLDAAVRALKPQMPFLTDLGVVLAIELHFEFTTFELLRLFERCGAEPGGCLGICLDTMNPLTMLEDPVAAAERVLPWVVATHVKDGGLLFDEKGFVSFTAEAGEGLVDLPRIVGLLAGLGRPVNLSLEDHGGSFGIPIFDPAFLARFPDLTAGELARLVAMAREGERRVREGLLFPVERSAWPGLCEERVARSLAKVKRMAEG